jgi:hypothetical protein
MQGIGSYKIKQHDHRLVQLQKIIVLLAITRTIGRIFYGGYIDDYLKEI